MNLNSLKSLKKFQERKKEVLVDELFEDLLKALEWTKWNLLQFKDKKRFVVESLANGFIRNLSSETTKKFEYIFLVNYLTRYCFKNDAGNIFEQFLDQ